MLRSHRLGERVTPSFPRDSTLPAFKLHKNLFQNLMGIFSLAANSPHVNDPPAELGSDAEVHGRGERVFAAFEQLHVAGEGIGCE